MSTDDRRLVQGKRAVPAGAEVEGPASAWGGAGMAIYAGMLIVLFFVAVGALSMASYVLLKQSSGSWSELEPGTAVPVWRLAPLRDAGLLGPDEVPLAWHDESMRLDGSIACALLPDALVRVDEGRAQRVAYSAVRAVDVQGTEESGVVVDARSEGETLRCSFRPQDGGERFARQVKAACGL
jgi:hypothetical protein